MCISIQGNRGVAASTQRAQLAPSDTAFGGRRPKFLAHIGKKKRSLTSFHPIFLLTLQWFSNQGVTLGAGFRLCLRGCDARNGGLCGSSTLSVFNDVSDALGYVGAALCEAASEWSVEPEYYAAA